MVSRHCATALRGLVYLCAVAVALGAFAAAPATDLRLRYQQPAKAWRESLFIGNGRLGGAVWGGAQRTRIDLNEDTLWSGEPYKNINTNGLPALPEIRRLLLAGKELEAQHLVEATMLGPLQRKLSRARQPADGFPDLRRSDELLSRA